MEFESLINDIVIFLGFSGLFVFLLSKFNVSSIFACLLSGIILSKNILGNYLSIEDSSIQFLLSLGSIMLLFLLGFEFPFSRIRKYTTDILVVSVIEIFFSISASYILLVYVFNFSPAYAGILVLALISGNALLISSTIKEMKIFKEEFASLMMGIILIETIIASIFISILGYFKAGTDFVTISMKLSLMTLFVGLMLIGGSYVMPMILKKIQGEKRFLSFAFLFAFLSSYSSFLIGMNPLTASFLSGLVIASSIPKPQYEEELNFAKEIAILLAFTSIGYFINISDLKNTIIISLALLATVFSSKMLSTYYSLKTFRYEDKLCLKSSLRIGAPGEVSLLVAISAINFGFVGRELLSILIPMVIAELIFLPYLFKSRFFNKK